MCASVAGHIDDRQRRDRKAFGRLRAIEYGVIAGASVGIICELWCLGRGSHSLSYQITMIYAHRTIAWQRQADRAAFLVPAVFTGSALMASAKDSGISRDDGPRVAGKVASV